MIHKNDISSPNEDLNIQKKKTYFSPVVSRLGGMKKVTLGGSYITEDSSQGPGPNPNP